MCNNIQVLQKVCVGFAERIGGHPGDKALLSARQGLSKDSAASGLQGWTLTGDGGLCERAGGSTTWSRAAWPQKVVGASVLLTTPPDPSALASWALATYLTVLRFCLAIFKMKIVSTFGDK